MLYLIQRNRLGRNIINKGNDTINWREAFKASEDSLTSSIFSLLLYLPRDLFWEIFYKACYYPSIPKESGKLLNVQFWPHWNCDNTRNINYIEPDMFLEFESFHLIIEAKRDDYSNLQDPSQWSDQIISYKNEYSDSDKKPLYFVALGGISIGSERQSPILNSSITICRWSRILNQIKVLIQHKKEIALSDQTLTVLQDLVLSFSLHGFRTGKLFQDFPKQYQIYKGENISLNIKYKKHKKVTLIDFPLSTKKINYKIF